MNLKPFNLEAALNGAKVVTRDGRTVSRVTYFPEIKGTDYPVKAIVEDNLQGFTVDGFYYTRNNESCIDLFLAPKLREGWINIYPHGNAVWYQTKEKADLYAAEIRVACIRIKWEE